ncbi:acyl-CoA thioesterase [Sphingomonas gilva]|nr:thioesterase family protein [Sphingomonas gilva]
MARNQFWMTERIRVRFTEVDRQSIVQNGAYFTYFSVALNEYFRALPFDRDGENPGAGFHVVSAEIQYRAPLRFDELFDIGARISRVGRSSFTMAYEIFRADGEDAIITGSQVWVNTDQTTRKATPLPDSFRDRVAAAEKQNVEFA